jgi:hypothetical protein
MILHYASAKGALEICMVGPAKAPLNFNLPGDSHSSAALNPRKDDRQHNHRNANSNCQPIR